MALEKVTENPDREYSPYWLLYEIETNGNYFCIVVSKRYKDGSDSEFLTNVDIPLVNVRCERSLYMGKDIQGVSLVGMKNLIDFPAETYNVNPKFPDEIEAYKNEFVLDGSGMDLWSLSDYFFSVTGANFMMGRPVQPIKTDGEIAPKF